MEHTPDCVLSFPIMMTRGWELLDYETSANVVSRMYCGRRTHSDISPEFLGLSNSSHLHHRITPVAPTTSATIPR